MSRPPIRIEDKSLLSSKWKYVLFTQSLTFSNNSGTRGGLQATVTGRGMVAKKIFDVKKVRYYQKNPTKKSVFFYKDK